MSLEVSRLKDAVSQLESERDSLKDQLLKAQTHSPVTSHAPEGAESASGAPSPENLVHEERLKWQVEMVKVRRELEGQLEGEKESRKKESDALKREVRRLEEELEKGKPLRGELDKSKRRFVSMCTSKRREGERTILLFLSLSALSLPLLNFSYLFPLSLSPLPLSQGGEVGG